MRTLFACLIAVALVAGSGCVRAGRGFKKQHVGAVTGAVAGGIVGSQFGSGAFQTASTIGGTVLGAYLGSHVGKTMDQSDRTRMEDAYKESHESRWSNDGREYIVGNIYRDKSTGQACRDLVIRHEGRSHVRQSCLERIRGRDVWVVK